MKKLTTSLFNFDDAWLLAALADAPLAVTLDQWLLRMDVLNHALPSFVQLRQSVQSLHQHGLIVNSDRGWHRTDHGQNVAEKAMLRRGGLFSICSNMLLALNSPSFEHPNASTPFDKRKLTIRTYQAAINRYRAMQLT